MAAELLGEGGGAALLGADEHHVDERLHHFVRPVKLPTSSGRIVGASTRTAVR